MLTRLPPELLSLVAEGIIREYLHEYFVCNGESWDAISTLLGVSTVLHGVTYSLLLSGLGIPRLEDGLPKPLTLVRMARRDATKRFEEACLIENGAALQNQAENDLSQWRVSPLLELYSAIRETQLHRDRIIQQGRQLRRLADLPNKLVDSLERVRDGPDMRLTRPALLEGAYLIADTNFVGHLATFAKFFDLVRVALSEAPEWLYGWFERIDKNIFTVEILEHGCMKYLHWAQSEHPRFLKPLHIHSTQIVPSLRKFVETPVIASDPLCEDWRRRVDALLHKWAPLDTEIREPVPEEPVEPARGPDH